MALGDDVYEREEMKYRNEKTVKNALQELLEVIETKNSWGKNELKLKILELLLKKLS